jgi:hypothetical protein
MKKLSMPLAVVLLLISIPAWAQPGPQGGMMQPPPGMMDGGGPGTCEDTCPRSNDRKMLEAMRITRMTEELKLTDKQIAEFFPKLKEMEANIKEMGKNQRTLIGQLDSMLNAGAKDQDLKAKMAQIDKAEAERWNQLKTSKAKIDGILTIKQQAKMLVFKQKFDQEIKDMVRDIRQKRMKQLKQ